MVQYEEIKVSLAAFFGRMSPVMVFLFTAMAAI